VREGLSGMIVILAARPRHRPAERAGRSHWRRRFPRAQDAKGHHFLLNPHLPWRPKNHEGHRLARVEAQRPTQTGGPGLLP